MTIKELANKIQNREVNIIELTTTYLEKIVRKQSKYNSYITVSDKYAIERAKQLEQQLDSMEKSNLASLSPLYGIPFSAKDLYLTSGIRTTGGTRMLNEYIPTYSASLIDRLEREGAILLGKTNCDPFGFGSSTENSDYGTSGNAYNPNYVSGGSSGGSAASVALDTSVFSLGTDTGGSIRQPASFNNVVGLKPTYGRSSRYGVIAYASSLDTMGPITKRVEDAAIVLNSMAGYDPLDATSSKQEVVDYTYNLGEDIKGIKIGIPRQYMDGEIDSDVRNAYEKSIKIFENLGAKIVEVSLDMSDYAVSAYYIISTSEASSNLARYDGIRYGYSDRSGRKLDDIYVESRTKGFNDEIKRRVLLGTYCLSSGYYDEYYKKALKLRTLVIEDYKKALEKVDIILAPVFPTPPFRIGEFESDPIQMWLADAFTVSLNVFGGPGLSLPTDFSRDGVPIGVQIIGDYFSEATLLKAGYAFEHESKLYLKTPQDE